LLMPISDRWWEQKWWVIFMCRAAFFVLILSPRDLKWWWRYFCDFKKILRVFIRKYNLEWTKVNLKIKLIFSTLIKFNLPTQINIATNS
jgi:hypothetical protein